MILIYFVTCNTVKHPQNYYNDRNPPKHCNAIKPRISVLCPEGHKQITRYYYHHTISSSIKFNLNPPAISCAKHLAPQSPQIAFSLGGWVGIITIALSCAQRGLRRTSEEICLPWSQVGSSESTRPLLGLKRKCHNATPKDKSDRSCHRLCQSCTTYRAS